MNDTTFSDPKRILDDFPIRKGETVVDIGSGYGTYSLLASERVGEDGSVYAVEVQLSLVDSLKNTANREDLDNLHVLWADAELPHGTKLADSIADSVILTNTLFTIVDKPGLVSEIKRIIKPEGKLLVVDWSESFSGVGPHVENIVSEKFARDLFSKNGFTFEKKLEAGSHHYGMILTNNK
jgi:ubiquinone/menaquinone biosynthesis C-methylase UbiE